MKTKLTTNIMNNILLRTAAGLVAISLMFSSCKKEDEKPVELEAEVAVEDTNTGLAESDEVISISEDDMNYSQSSMRIAATNEASVTYTNAHGATVTFTPKGTNATGSIIIDFGTNGIKSGRDNKTRKGKIITTFTGRYRMPGTTQIITFENYYVNGNRVEGTKVLTHTYENNTFSTTINVTGGKITFIDNSVLEWNSERVRNWNLNNTPFNLEDDEFSVSGTCSGKSRNGKSFSAIISAVNPLIWKFSCFNESKFVAVSGIIRISPQGADERSVDYGNGTCDRDVTISVGDVSKTITLNK
jgi:hypothetical protein